MPISNKRILFKSGLYTLVSLTFVFLLMTFTRLMNVSNDIVFAFGALGGVLTVVGVVLYIKREVKSYQTRK